MNIFALGVRTFRRLRAGLAWKETAVVFWAICLFVPAALVAIWLLPQWQVAQIPEVALDRHSSKYFEIQNEARRTIAQVILGVFSAFAIFLAWRRAHTADGTLKVAEQGHITDRLTKAVEQLGASDEGRPVVETRIGAIYALERISIDSSRDYWSVIDIIAEYLSQHAKPENLQTSAFLTFLNTNYIRADLKAALRVLQRRRDPQQRFGHRLQLSDCYLPWTTIAGDFAQTQLLNCDLSKDQFISTDFSESSFARVSFRDCGFHDVKLDRTQQFSVSYHGAKLRGSSFMDATLSQVDFRGATLDSVDFRGAKMTNVAVGGADLRNTFGLTFVMLQGTIGDDKTLLPKGIDAPKRWSEAGPIERSFALFHPPLYTGVTGPQDTGQDGITTRLLFPYVTNQAGFDTGISLSNISDDPFGSAKNDGICTVHYYGSLVGGGVAPKAQTTLVLHAGEQAIFTLSGGGSHGIYSTPGFQGYIIAECRFKAAGLGFVSDTDAKRVGSCYVAQRL